MYPPTLYVYTYLVILSSRYHFRDLTVPKCIFKRRTFSIDFPHEGDVNVTTTVSHPRKDKVNFMSLFLYYHD